jgi:hypothetical protein
MTFIPVHLDDELATFLAGGVSIHIAARDAQRVPSVARAKGCRVMQGEPQKLRLFTSASQAGRLVDDVRDNGMVSVTFTVPTTNYALQFKSRDCRVVALGEGDRETMERYVEVFGEALSHLGIQPHFVRAFFSSPADEIAVEFTPTEMFQQTPGPAAGTKLS